ncbi:MAG: hypothetical protein K9L28_05525, partial [Synergistales bacterium]|nr:hypothetical protein [Synergistales bacterium]
MKPAETLEQKPLDRPSEEWYYAPCRSRGGWLTRHLDKGSVCESGALLIFFEKRDELHGEFDLG